MTNVSGSFRGGRTDGRKVRELFRQIPEREDRGEETCFGWFPGRGNRWGGKHQKCFGQSPRGGKIDGRDSFINVSGSFRGWRIEGRKVSDMFRAVPGGGSRIEDEQVSDGVQKSFRNAS